MSLLIKGMEMPKSCCACYLKMNCDDCEGYECVCLPLRTKIGYLDDLLTDKRRDDCPLVLVPPHGRLIDADALMKILSKVIDINASIEQRNEATDQERRCLWWFEQQIGIAPTIIPASFENLPKSKDSQKIEEGE